MVNVIGEPVQPVATTVGVTVILAVWIDVPLFLNVNESIFPVPEAARPIEVLVFVQL